VAYWQRDYNRWWWRTTPDGWMDWNGSLGRTIKQSWPHFSKRLNACGTNFKWCLGDFNSQCETLLMKTRKRDSGNFYALFKEPLNFLHHIIRFFRSSSDLTSACFSFQFPQTVCFFFFFGTWPLVQIPPAVCRHRRWLKLNMFEMKL